VFNDDYYSHDVDKEKPVFPDDEDDGGLLLLLFFLMHTISTQCCTCVYSYHYDYCSLVHIRRVSM